MRKNLGLFSLLPVLTLAGAMMFQTAAPTPAAKAGATPAASAPAAGALTGGVADVHSLLGAPVVDRSGKNAGQIVDLVIDLNAGRANANGSAGAAPAASSPGPTASSSSGSGTGAAGTTGSGAGNAPVTSPKQGSAASGQQLASASQSGGTLLYAVIGFSGFLGIGQARVSVPWSLLRYEGQQNRVVLNGTAGDLSSAPRFSPASDGGILAPGWDQSVQSYWTGKGRAANEANCPPQPAPPDAVRFSIQGGPWYGRGDANVAEIGALNSFTSNEPGVGLGASRALDTSVPAVPIATFGDGVIPGRDSAVVGCMPPADLPTLDGNLAPSALFGFGSINTGGFNPNTQSTEPRNGSQAHEAATTVLASTLLGSAVRDSANVPAGTLGDLIMDLRGQMTYGIVDASAAAGDQVTVAPWRLFDYSGVRILSFESTVAALQKAPHVAPGTQLSGSSAAWEAPAAQYWQKVAPPTGAD